MFLEPTTASLFPNEVRSFDVGPQDAEQFFCCVKLAALSGTQSADNLVITAGKMSVTDIFDTNAYADDPKVDFLKPIPRPGLGHWYSRWPRILIRSSGTHLSRPPENRYCGAGSAGVSHRFDQQGGSQHHGKIHRSSHPRLRERQTRSPRILSN